MLFFTEHKIRALINDPRVYVLGQVVDVNRKKQKNEEKSSKWPKTRNKCAKRHANYSFNSPASIPT